MSFTIHSVSIYGHAKQRRTITFKRDGLNVLTGRAKTGKSAMIDIISYCLGRNTCHVAEGIIRQHVSWFALEIEKDRDILFVARKNPGPGRRTSPEIHVRRGRHSSLPGYEDLTKNITRDALVQLLTRFAGIEENEYRPRGGVGEPLRANIKHALFLCFQRQDEIANQTLLFHRQSEDFIPRAIRDTLPYFLGAMDKDHFRRRNELDDAERALHELQARRTLVEREADRNSARMMALALRARSLGLIHGDLVFENDEQLAKTLEALTEKETEDEGPGTTSDMSGDVVELEDEIQNLRGSMRRASEEIRATEHFSGGNMSSQMKTGTEESPAIDCTV